MRDDEVWPLIPDDDLWIFDKLILSRKLGYVCGPIGMDVPKSGEYVVRPCVNLMGMGLGAKIYYIYKDTDDYTVGHFWQEVFEGRHLSIDYSKGKQSLCVEGFKKSRDLTRFSRWVRVEDKPELPELVQDIVDRYDTVNVEMIGGKVIEVHLRENPDFADGALECLPVWSGEEIKTPDGYTFVEDRDARRIGFYKRYAPR